MVEREAAGRGKEAEAGDDAAPPGALYEALLDKVFVTPRIVDQRAFEDFAGSLRTLVKDAAAQSRDLSASAGEVKGLAETLRAATSELKQRIETAARVTPALDQRVAKAESLLDATVKDLGARVREVQEIATKGIAIDREGVARAVREATERVVAAIVAEESSRFKARITAAAEEAAEHIRGRGEATAADLSSTAAGVDRAVSAALARAEGVIARVQGALAGFEETRRAIDTALEGAQSRLATAATEAQDAAATCESARMGVETAAAEAGVRLGAAITEAERRAAAILKSTESRLAEVESRVAVLADQAARVDAERMVAVARSTGEVTAEAQVVASELRELLSRFESARCDNARIEPAAPEIVVPSEARDLSRLEQLLERAELVGRGLDRLVREARPLAERLEARVVGAGSD